MTLRKNDILLAVGLLLAAALMWLVFRPGGEGAYVVVTQNSDIVCRLPLSEDSTTELTDSRGGFNILVIENGEAFISDADCGDHTCIRTGRISREGERIVCLPHKLVIEIEGGEAFEADISTH